jgi:hypothetical protein
MDVFKETRKLNLADTDFVVVGGGLLVALGLVGWDGDIDLCVAPDIYAKFKQAGWHEETGGWKGKPVLRRGIYDVGVGFGDWSLEDLQTDAVWIDNVPFINPEKLLVWKRQANRPKDLRHITLIEAYLAKQQNKP